MLWKEIQRDLHELDGSSMSEPLVRRIRDELGLTQRELADILCISQSALAQYESENHDKQMSGPAAKLLRLHVRYSTI